MYLGLDLGTSNVKAVIVSEDHRILSSSSVSIPVSQTGEGVVEQDITTIWSAVKHAIKNAAEKVDRSNISAIGVSSQGASLLILDRNGQPEGAVISWMDGRGRQYGDKLVRELGTDWLTSHVGHGDCGIIPAQILRLKTESPQLFTDNPIIADVGSATVHHLCGRVVLDYTSLSIWGLLNPERRQPDPEYLNKLQIHREQLPDLVKSGECAGQLLPVIAKELNLPANIPVSAAIHDQYAAALSVGAVHDKTIMLGTGTAWVLMAMSDRIPSLAIQSAYVCPHPVEGLYGQMLSMVNGGSSVSWARRTLNIDLSSCTNLDSMLDGISAGSDGVVVLPFFSPSVRYSRQGARILGLRLSHTPAHILKAILEGLACELGRHMRVLQNDISDIDQILMCGGAAVSSITPQIISNVMELKVKCFSSNSTSALGAAIIAEKISNSGMSLKEVSYAYETSSYTVEPNNDYKKYQQLFSNYEDLMKDDNCNDSKIV